MKVIRSSSTALLVACYAGVRTSLANVIPSRDAHPPVLSARFPGFRAPDFHQAVLTKRGSMEHDIPFLNLALTIEYLEDALYKRGLQRYSDEDFKNGGYLDWARGRISQISDHQRTHIEFLQSAVSSTGAEYVKPCEYTFGDKDAGSFIMTSEAVEAVGTATYTALTQFFNHRAYLTPISSMLATEARHAAWIHSVLLHGNPWSTAFETSLTPNQAYTLVSAFTTPESCPQTNQALLPFDLRAYPLLSLPSRIIPGGESELLFSDPSAASGEEHLYAAFTFGATTVFTRVKERDGGKFFTQIPRDLRAQGVVFVTVVRGGPKMSDVRTDDKGTVAGPALIMFPFDGHGNPAMG